ncbi:ArsR family transcriptional regulator [Candidatus Woesearchaeota archaeon]|nr:ArsR family transcriptional regulator [Candidatus Woesearchaeota archaeon]
MIKEFQITIKKIKKPKSANINENIQFLAESLGLFNKRDKEKSCYRVFLELVKNKSGLTAEEITLTTNLTRPTIIHHLKNLLESNLIVKEKSRYKIKKESLNSMISSLEDELDSTLNELKEIAKDIDSELIK